MLSDTIRILNFDNALSEQKVFLKRYQPNVVDLTHLGPAVRLWSDRIHAQKVSAALNPGLKNALTFLGSGDFHHISSLLIDQFEEPNSVIVFDHHPDWDILPPAIGCGSWVSRTLRRSNVQKAVLLGIGSDDIDSYSIQTGNLAALKRDRVEIYPYAHGPTKTFLRKVPANVSLKVKNGFFFSTIVWNELRTQWLEEFLPEVISRLPTQKVYISIDKDCLQGAYAATNWEEGFMPLDQLLMMLRLIRKQRDIVGADVTGDHSPALIAGWFKKKCSDLDHPRQTSSTQMSPEKIGHINELTNMKIVEALTA